MSDFLVGFLVGGGMIQLGVWTGMLRERRKQPKQPAPVCGCKHHYAQHDLRTGECHDKTKIPNKWDSYGNPVAYRFDPCTCRHYTGPEPVSAVFMPPPPLPRSTDAD